MVVLVDSDRAKGKRALETLRREHGERAHFEHLDVADANAVQAATKKTIACSHRLDIVVNNAVTQEGFETPLERLDLADWQRGLDVNLTGPMLVSRAALPHLRKANGAIVNISSTRALMSEAHTETYAACKGGLNALTHALAISLGPDVRVNGIAPGWIAAPDAKLSQRDHAQHPCGRVGRPEDVAIVATYLASDEAAFVTGQIFTIDGGMTRKMIYAE